MRVFSLDSARLLFWSQLHFKKHIFLKSSFWSIICCYKFLNLNYSSWSFQYLLSFRISLKSVWERDFRNKKIVKNHIRKTNHEKIMWKIFDKNRDNSTLWYIPIEYCKNYCLWSDFNICLSGPPQTLLYWGGKFLEKGQLQGILK